MISLYRMAPEIGTAWSPNAAIDGVMPDRSEVPTALRLTVSIKAEAERLAAEEGTSLNQFEASAVAEKLAALRTAEFFTGRKGFNDRTAFRRLLTRDSGSAGMVECFFQP